MNRRQRVLLADSSRFFRTIESKFLQKTPVEILEAADRDATLELLRNDPPDLVFLAYELAMAGEPALCVVLKSDRQINSIPVVVICDQNMPEQVTEVQRMEADACLVKPLDRHSFLKIGRRFLSGIREHRQPSFFPLSFTLNGQELTGKCLDISGGGMFIESHVDVAAGNTVDLKFRLPDGTSAEIQCQAQVTWRNFKPNPIKPHYPFGFGVKFTELSDRVQQAILRLADKQSP